jgi:hypothetical protein
MMKNLYDTDFYESQMQGSLKSAFKYADLISKIYNFKSVVDIGCGRGTWLKAFNKRGCEIVVGYDGAYNNQQNMIDKSIKFCDADLNNPNNIDTSVRYELAISLEVAEHVEKKSASDFILLLTKLSDSVLFGAAYPRQGGINHVNEQKPSYWAKIFTKYGYVPYDLFRPAFWGDNDIEYWYQQNTFLYVKKNSALENILIHNGNYEIKNINFMDCVHPNLFEGRMKSKALFRTLIVNAIPDSLLPIARKINNIIG